MDALAEICEKLSAIDAAARHAFQSNPRAADQDPTAKEWLRLRNLQLKLEREAVERVSAARACGITENFLGKSFDDFETATDQQREAVAACEEFRSTWWERKQAGDHTSLWILGPTGTGKTRLASALIAALHLEDCASARIVTPTTLIREIRDTWGQRGKEQSLLDQLAAIDVMVIDDLGRSFGSAFEIVQLTELIDMRYTRGNPTLLTSNRNEPQLKKLLGERAFSRLRDGRRIVLLTGDDYRQPLPVPEAPTRAHAREGAAS